MKKQKTAEQFSALYQEVYQDLYRFALYTLGNPQDAEDVVADAVADAYRSFASLREQSAFRPWIFRILSVKCSRKRKEYVNKTAELPEELEAREIPLEDYVQVRTAFLRLDDQERQMIALKVWGGYNSREIAALYEMNDNTVRSRISRGLGKLREWLQ